MANPTPRDPSVDQDGDPAVLRGAIRQGNEQDGMLVHVVNSITRTQRTHTVVRHSPPTREKRAVIVRASSTTTRDVAEGVHGDSIVWATRGNTASDEASVDVSRPWVFRDSSPRTEPVIITYSKISKIRNHSSAFY